MTSVRRRSPDRSSTQPALARSSRATAAEALECIGVDRDWFDAIESQWVDEEFIHLLAKDENG